MLNLVLAAAVAAQPAPTPNAPTQQMPMQHEQHDGMKKDCCADCCKDMADKHEGHGSEHAEHGSH